MSSYITNRSRIQQLIDSNFPTDVIAHAFLACMDLDVSYIFKAREYFKLSNNTVGQSLATSLINQYKLNVPFESTIHCVDHNTVLDELGEYMIENGCEAVRIVSNETDKHSIPSLVVLVKEQNGTLKIYKEVIDRSGGRLGEKVATEDEIYAHLKECNQVGIPRYYGSFQLPCGVKFIRLETLYGYSLSDAPNVNVDKVYKRMQEIVTNLHRNSVLHLDLRLENFIVTDEGFVFLIDFGMATFIESPQDEVNVYLYNSLYCDPSVVLTRKASYATELIQIEKIKSILEGSLVPVECENPEATILTNLLPDLLANSPAFSDTEYKLSVLSEPIKKEKTKRRDMVLFPARMGVPHKGHLEYIKRLLYLGFYVEICMMKSFTLTNEDPIHKIVVEQMLDTELKALGYHKNLDYGFKYVPFPKNDDAWKLYFLMHYGEFPKLIVASGNLGIHHIFKDSTILDQATVFSTEENINNYTRLSWGSLLRKAINTDYIGTYNYFCLPAMRNKMAEMKKMMERKQTIEYVPGNVYLQINGEKIRTRKYLTVEQLTGLPIESVKVVSTEFDGTDEIIYLEVLL